MAQYLPHMLFHPGLWSRSQWEEVSWIRISSQIFRSHSGILVNQRFTENWATYKCFWKRQKSRIEPIKQRTDKAVSKSHTQIESIEQLVSLLLLLLHMLGPFQFLHSQGSWHAAQWVETFLYTWSSGRRKEGTRNLHDWQIRRCVRDPEFWELLEWHEVQHKWQHNPQKWFLGLLQVFVNDNIMNTLHGGRTTRTFLPFSFSRLSKPFPYKRNNMTWPWWISSDVQHSAVQLNSTVQLKSTGIVLQIFHVFLNYVQLWDRIARV